MECKRSELRLAAVTESLPEVISMIERHLEEVGCPAKVQMQITVAAEEIFVNIAHYAYGSEQGEAIVRVETEAEPTAVVITFIDEGAPFDPLNRPDPDVTLSAQEREIGGLGIYMTKRIMDDVHYERLDGRNILTLRKIIS